MSTSRLLIYNGALRACGERSLASLSEAREPRYLLDDVWNDGGVRACLEMAQWKFAMRAAEFTYESSVTPSWGYQYAFSKPTDWVNTSAVCSDEFFNNPLEQYSDEIQYWFADITPLYIKYVSDAITYGNNLANWPVSFTRYVEAYFAANIVLKLTNGEKRWGAVQRVLKSTKLTAMNKDAMAGPTTKPATGNWVRARGGGRRRDGGFTSGDLTE